MTVENISRRAGPFIGDGTVTAFPFEFKIFDTSQLSVQRTNVEGGVDVLRLSEDYTVALNADQDENPGGTVNILTPLAQALRLAIISAIPADQTVKVTNYDRFYPKIYNDVFDKLTGLIQQLEENLSRAVTTDPTDVMSPGELKNKLLDAANDATVIAKGYAEAAAASATEAKKSRDDILEHQQEVIAAITTEGDKQDQRLVTEGDTQINRIKAETDNTLIVNGKGCAEKFWTLANDVAAGTGIAIPGGIKYLVNRHHLRVSWNGLVLAIGQNFTEVGAEDTFSDTFRLTFDAKAGDEIDIWIGALGKGDVSQAIALAGEASAAVADLSRKVVYKEEV